jgi:hypothetical protein
MLKQNCDYRPQLAQLRSANPELPLPDNKKDCSKALCKSHKKEKEIIKALLQHREEELLRHMKVCNLRGATNTSLKSCA